MGLGWGRSIRFVFNAAAPSKGFKGLWESLKQQPRFTRSLFHHLHMYAPILLYTDAAQPNFPFNVACPCSASCGGEVKGSRARWSQQEVTSVVWHLTRTDCVTDACGVHPGFSGHGVARLEVRRVRAASMPFLPTADSRKSINFKDRLIIRRGV